MPIKKVVLEFMQGKEINDLQQWHYIRTTQCTGDDPGGWSL